MLDRRETARKLVLSLAGGAAPLARRLVGGVGAILMLHKVTEGAGGPLGVNDHLSIRPKFLDALLAEMKRLGTRFVSMDEAAERLSSGGRGERFATVTADDGYRDNIVEALPVLEKHQVPITIYVAPGLVDGAVDLWWEVLERAVAAADRLSLPDGRMVDCGIPAAKREAFARLLTILTTEIEERQQRDAVRDLARQAGVDTGAPARQALMGWDELRRAAAHPLVTIGAHTIHHYHLRRLGAEEALSEMAEAGSVLAARLGQKPRHMAYPYGYPLAVGLREPELARQAGYVSAVTTRHGVLLPGHGAHLHALPRISVNGRYQDVGYVTTMLSGVTTPLANRGKRLVTV